ncbi:YadA C-terminal domain-containing protein [Enterobacter cloacae]|uniref:YadA C-terminal domain-containing protein n=1 Tax=Enterobacter cloacae TaxID=550 RepID=UPI00101B06B5|nr:YadA C-terminal domain-containing protein [Enterobacter cloacae]QBC02007.1 hypothetical protein EWI30_07935 [Enterobacter cloacae]
MKPLNKSTIAVFVLGVVFAGSTNTAKAALTGADLAAANSYFNSHPDIVKYAPWIRDNVMNSGSLADANNTLLNNSYYDQGQGKVIYVSQIGGITPPVPMTSLTPATAPSVSNDSRHPTNEHHEEIVTPYIDGVHNQAAVITPATKPDQTQHLDSNATPEQQQHAKDQAMIKYLQSQIKNGESGKNGRDGIKGDSGSNGLDGTNGKDGVTTTVTQIQVDTATQTKVDRNSKQVAANTVAVDNVQSRQQAQETTIQSHSSQLTNHEERITALENESNNNFQNLKNDVDNNRKRAAVGVASVAAMSNIPQVTDSQIFAIGAGVGEYDSQGAIAVGFSARVTEHVVTKASVGAGSYGGATVGAGVSYGW